MLIYSFNVNIYNSFVDSIATFGETTGYYALKYMQQKMKENEEGREILRFDKNLSKLLKWKLHGNIIIYFFLKRI